MSEELLRQLSRLLSADGQEPEGTVDPHDLADVLWMARVAGLGAEQPELPDLGALDLPPIDDSEDLSAATAWDAQLRAAVKAASRERETRERETDAGRPRRRADRRPSTPPPGAAAVDREVVQLHLPPPESERQPDGLAAAVIRSPARPALTGTLAMSRALRPLRRTVRSSHSRVLDEHATTGVSGRAGLLLPVWHGAPERWLDVDLIVDGSPSMAVWSSLAGELSTLLGRHGAFGTVRSWSLAEEGGAPVLQPFRRPGRRAATRRTDLGLPPDPRGRRVVLVLTDGVGSLWRGRALTEAMRVWSRTAPVTVLQVLPRRLWHRTAVQPVPARARVRPGGRPTVVFSSEELHEDRPGDRYEDRPAGSAWATVLELRADWLAPWARMLAGRSSGWTRVMAIPLDHRIDAPEPTPESHAAADPEGSGAGALVSRFRREASPVAFELAGFLAAAPLSLPVMRYVQRAMLPESTTMHLAEVYLSGLLERLSPERPGEDPEEVVYDFRPGVRSSLLSTLTTGESVQVLDVLARVSQTVSRTFGGTLDFRALAALARDTDDGAPSLPRLSIPFAEVAVEVLEGLGGKHGALAAELARTVPSRRGATTAAPPAMPPAADGLPAAATAARRDAGPDRDGRADRERGRRRWWRPSRNGTSEPDAGSADLSPERRDFDPSWNNLPPLRADLTGRAAQLVEVERILHPNGGLPARAEAYPSGNASLCVVQGPSGSGKTELALAYAHLHRSDYTLVWWIDGRERWRIRNSLEQLGTLLGFAPLNADAGAAARREAVRPLMQWLRDNPGWLIVLDDLGWNMPGQEKWLAGFSPKTLLDELWPPDGYGSVLVTSQVESSDMRALEGNVLRLASPEDVEARALAKALLQGSDGRRSRDRAAAADQDAELGALSDVIARTAALADRSPAAAAESRGSAENDDRPAAFYRRSLEGLEAGHPNSVSVLRLCAFLAPSGITTELLELGIRSAATDPPSHGTAGEFTSEALTPLRMNQLIRVVPNVAGSVSIRVPSALQRVVRSRMTPEERQHWRTAAIAAVHDAFPDDPAEPWTWELCAVLLPHAHTVLESNATNPDALRMCARLFHRLAQFRAARGDVTAARTYLRHESELRDGTGNDDPEAAEAQFLLAEVLRAEAQLVEAQEQVRRALAAIPAHPESVPTSLLRCRALRLEAGVCRDRIDFEGSLRALEEAQRCLAEAPVATRGDSRSVGLEENWVLRELCVTHLQAGRLGEAYNHLNRAWAERQRWSRDHREPVGLLDVALRQDQVQISMLADRPNMTECQVLARVLKQLGAVQNMESLDVVMGANETLVDVMRERLVRDAVRRGYGSVYPVAGAEPLGAVLEAVMGFRSSRKDRQPHRYATFLDVRGMLVAALGEPDEGLAILAEAAELHESVHGRSHPAWADNRVRQARILADTDRPEEAHALLLEAEPVLTARLGRLHPRLVPVYAALAATEPDADRAAHWRRQAELVRRTT